MVKGMSGESVYRWTQEHFGDERRKRDALERKINALYRYLDIEPDVNACGIKKGKK